jgi:hypothetical protein
MADTSAMLDDAWAAGRTMFVRVFGRCSRGSAMERGGNTMGHSAGSQLTERRIIEDGRLSGEVGVGAECGGRTSGVLIGRMARRCLR